VLFRLRESGLAVAPDVADDRDGSPDERSRTENENAVQNQHRGEDNKLGVEVRADRASRPGEACPILILAEGGKPA
jgi:hypothetical protein